MFKNYLKSAIRNHIKSKWNSLINIFSLAIGIASCILIFVFVSHELSFDKFHQNADDIHRIYYTVITAENESYNITLQPHSLVEELQYNFPEIKHVTAFQKTQALIEYEDLRFTEQFAKVDTSFLSMFDFPLIVGDKSTVLSSHDKIIISERMANKFFGDENLDYLQVLGKVLTINGWKNKKDYVITGILKDVPKTSSLQFDMLMLKENNDYYSLSNNPFGDLSVYVQLNKDYNNKTFESSLNKMVDKIYGKPIKELRELGALKNGDDCFTLNIQPLSDVYLDNTINNKYELQSNKIYSYILAGIGLLIIILACINFINLSVGQSLHKTLEIGIRKVLGAGRKQIIIQYSIEKILLILLALLTGYILSEFLLPMFNQLSEKELTISVYNNWQLPLFMFSALIITSLFAAGIPSLILSKVNPTGVFKTISRLGGKSRVNSVLIIVQFFLSIVLLTSAFIMSQQINFMQDKNLGFDKDQVVVVPISKQFSDIYKNKILAFPEIVVATGCDRNFSNGNSSRLFTTEAGKPIEANIIRVEEDYINTLDIKLLEGRNFSKEFSADNQDKVIVNETFVKEFNLQNPIGYVLNGEFYKDINPIVIGVVSDYHLFSMRSKIPPLVLHMTPMINGSWSLLVKVKANNVTDALKILEIEWKATVPNRDFNYTFLDDDLNSMYTNEQRWQKITGISTLFAFVISCLGLLGLALIITNTRTKEIGIRKVLGASITTIVAILNKNITKWILISNMLAVPATMYIMDQWLGNYEYHIAIDWWIFIITGFASLTIALLTVSFQTIRAALANPIKSLRYE